MKKEIKKKNDSKVELEVEVSTGEFEESKEKVLKELAREAELPGFRKGKVPADVVKEKVGEEKVLTETAQKAIEESFRKIVSEEELEPITQPEVQILKLAPDNPFRYKASFTVLPEVELPDYKEIASQIEGEDVSVSEEEVEETLNWLQKSRPNLKKVLRPAKKGDWVEVAFSSPRLGGGRRYEDSFILGKGKLIPGFSDHLLGMSAGEKKEFSLTLPQDFKVKEIAGQPAKFSVEVKDVKETEEREINDEFAKDVGEFDSLEELKENIRAGLTQEKEQKEKQGRRAKILDKIVKKCNLEAPQVLVERETERQLAQLKRRVREELKSSFEDYLEKVNKTEEELRKTLAKEAKSRAERFLVLRAIAKEEDVKVEKEEVEEEVNNYLAQFPDAQKAKENVDLKQLRSYTRDRLRNEKVLQILEQS